MTRSRILLSLALGSAFLAGAGLLSPAQAQQTNMYSNEDLQGDHFGAFGTMSPAVVVNQVVYIPLSSMGTFTFDGAGGGSFNMKTNTPDTAGHIREGSLSYSVNADGSGQLALTLASPSATIHVFDMQIVSSTKRGAEILLNERTPGEVFPGVIRFALGVGHLTRD
jgi:hypothetical protein